MAKQRRSNVNYGIQADSVTAEVQAVGAKASASKYVAIGSPGELLEAIKDLQSGISRLPAVSRKAADIHLESIQAEAKKRKPSVRKVTSALQALKTILDGAGNLISHAGKVAASLQRIANLVGISLSSIGFN